MFGLHRKSLIRAFGRPPSPKRRRTRRGRPPRYGPELLAPLKRIWLKADQPCAKRLVAVLPLWLPHYERRHGELEPDQREALLAASPATLDRMLKPLRAQQRKGRSATRAAKQLAGQIPIRTRFQTVDGPGWLEADTVAHCGDSLSGAFVWSVTLTDIWSGWTESRAIWNRGSSELVARVRDIETHLPFELIAFDSDNGSEFLNWGLLRYLRQRPIPVDFTRSRPYRKNDQAHIEQKQWTHVRQLLGYQRLEKKRLVDVINELYRGPWRAMQNFFQPSMQLIAKSREGGHLRRHHSRPKTPYQRLTESDKVTQEDKKRLRKEFESLDPFELRRSIDERLRFIFRIVRANRKGAPKPRAADQPFGNTFY